MSIEVRSLIKGATILLLALAWNEAAKKFVNVLLPIKNNESKSIFHNAVIYAVFITIILVCLVAFFNFIKVKTTKDPDTRGETLTSQDLGDLSNLVPDKTRIRRMFHTGLF